MNRLRVFYRSTGPDHFPRRPPYFDKHTCLRSFLLAYRNVADRSEIVFLNDGPVPEERIALMRQWGSVIQLPGIGNGPSFRRCIDGAMALADDRIAYFAEDDYLYVATALDRMLEVFDAVPAADYVTLYDHLDRYRRSDDARGGLSRMVVAAGQHWRTVESTCLSFGARVARLRRDRWAVRLTARSRGRPADRAMWRLIQGRKLFAWKFPKRMLFGPVPSLASHMDTASLAPVVNWESVAAEAAAAPLD